MDDELVKMIEKLYLLNDTSDEEDIEDTKVSNDESDYLVISDHEVIVLIINNVMDLNHQRFKGRVYADHFLYVSDSEFFLITCNSIYINSIITP